MRKKNKSIRKKIILLVLSILGLIFVFSYLTLPRETLVERQLDITKKLAE
ncbi:hypothetical protein NHE_0132 [Neorickettsia helminthoeca str. Oregon]|uniref:Uncharacterized protein n=1 Tax=Neorickettsia helminthoeca str. Oregon TaxID=1286528 RepID=X5H3H2_9RICK|nr:hypothetical protein [Neorickettsia helminthoeca]AHX11101.1 hypothetical protein NHE_0132 [Neorickettsia helminthoeca str. Oregon]